MIAPCCCSLGREPWCIACPGCTFAGLLAAQVTQTDCLGLFYCSLPACPPAGLSVYLPVCYLPLSTIQVIERVVEVEPDKAALVEQLRAQIKAELEAQQQQQLGEQAMEAARQEAESRAKQQLEVRLKQVGFLLAK